MQFGLNEVYLYLPNFYEISDQKAFMDARTIVQIAHFQNLMETYAN